MLRHETLQNGTQSCRSCGGDFEAVRFDPVQPVIVVPSLAGVGPEAGAPCAQHARNQAEASCTRCGQFMCALCKIDADGQVLCPPCYDRLTNEGAVAGGAMRVKNYAGYALACVIGSYAMFGIVSPFTGSLGIYFCVKGLQEKRARSEKDGIGRLYVLMVINALTLLGGIAFLALMLGVFAMSRNR
jgi:hypothetical protein